MGNLQHAACSLQAVHAQQCHSVSLRVNPKQWLEYRFLKQLAMRHSNKRSTNFRCDILPKCRPTTKGPRQGGVTVSCDACGRSVHINGNGRLKHLRRIRCHGVLHSCRRHRQAITKQMEAVVVTLATATTGAGRLKGYNCITQPNHPFGRRFDNPQIWFSQPGKNTRVIKLCRLTGATKGAQSSELLEPNVPSEACRDIGRAACLADKCMSPGPEIRGLVRGIYIERTLFYDYI